MAILNDNTSAKGSHAYLRGRFRYGVFIEEFTFDSAQNRNKKRAGHMYIH